MHAMIHMRNIRVQNGKKEAKQAYLIFNCPQINYFSVCSGNEFSSSEMENRF